MAMLDEFRCTNPFCDHKRISVTSGGRTEDLERRTERLARRGIFGDRLMGRDDMAVRRMPYSACPDCGLILARGCRTVGVWLGRELVLTVSEPCWECGGIPRGYERLEDIRCPKCGWPMGLDL